MLHKLNLFSFKGCVALCLMLLVVFGVAALPHSVCAADPAPSVTCAKKAQFVSTTPGENIVKTVFATIQTVLSKIGETMYKGIVGNASFQNVVKVSITLYVAIYGFMVMLGMAQLRMSDVISRLIRIAIIYGLLAFGVTGWAMFDRYFGALFMGGMNELIFNFALAAGVPMLPPASVSGLGIGITPTLNPIAVSALYAPMNIMFKPFYIFAVLGLMVLKPAITLIMAIALLWAFWDFTMMILGALITYVKAIVGLTFLFGIAPIFIIFLLFEKTRVLFFGWVNQVVSFAIAPVLLFAFLSFYMILLVSVLDGLFANVDFCWGTAGSIPGTTTDVNWWRPAMRIQDPNDPSKLIWVQVNGDWVDAKTLAPLPPPISVVSLLMFVMVCHLGKNFTRHITDMAGKISNGIGPGIVTGGAASAMLRGGFAGMGGAGGGGSGGGLFGGGGSGGGLFGGGRSGAAALATAGRGSTARGPIGNSPVNTGKRFAGEKLNPVDTRRTANEFAGKGYDPVGNPQNTVGGKFAASDYNPVANKGGPTGGGNFAGANHNPVGNTRNTPGEGPNSLLDYNPVPTDKKK